MFKQVCTATKLITDIHEGSTTLKYVLYSKQREYKPQYCSRQKLATLTYIGAVIPA